MAVRISPDAERLIDSGHKTVRRIQEEVLPSAEDRLERSIESVLDSIERQLDSATQRLSDEHKNEGPLTFRKRPANPYPNRPGPRRSTRKAQDFGPASPTQWRSSPPWFIALSAVFLTLVGLTFHAVVSSGETVQRPASAGAVARLVVNERHEPIRGATEALFSAGAAVPEGRRYGAGPLEGKGDGFT